MSLLADAAGVAALSRVAGAANVTPFAGEPDARSLLAGTEAAIPQRHFYLSKPCKPRIRKIPSKLGLSLFGFRNTLYVGKSPPKSFPEPGGQGGGGGGLTFRLGFNRVGGNSPVVESPVSAAILWFTADIISASSKLIGLAAGA
jgi:hypothetical protein